MIIAAIPAGFAAGLFGIGGGLITVPILFYIFGAAGIEPAYLMHLAVGTSFGIIIPTSIVSVLTHHQHKAVDFSVVKGYGLFVIIGGTSVMIVTRIDMMMIGSMLDLEQVAYYTVAFFIGNAIIVPARAIASISIPLIAKAWEEQDFDEIQTLYSNLSSLNKTFEPAPITNIFSSLL